MSGLQLDWWCKVVVMPKSKKVVESEGLKYTNDDLDIFDIRGVLSPKVKLPTKVVSST